MRNSTARLVKKVGLVAVFVGFLLTRTVLAAPGPTASAEGTIIGVAAGGITLATATGSQTRVAVTGDTLVIQRKAVKLEDIRPNDFVGVTARREADGSLTAVSITIFPPEFKGRVREAQFVMDTGNIMTNATVFQNVRRVEGRTLYLKLPDRTAVIAVPRAAEVFRLTVLKVSDLKQGMRVVVRGTSSSDGGLVATTITIVQ